jgi:glycosyltransferase involved in cell wall biosynthesis
MKLISIVTPCYNEEGNVRNLTGAVKSVFAGLPGYAYEHIFIDNASTDSTPSILRQLAAEDSHVKVILNTKNFGWLRSPYYGLLQGRGAATVYLPADFQEPPNAIPQFLKAWEKGHKVVLGVRAKSRENWLLSSVRRFYYFLIKHAAEIEHIDNFHGFGLYDKTFIDTLKRIDAPNPYFRGLVAEFGYDMVRVEYSQSARVHGRTKSNLYLLYDTAMLGFVNHSKVPLRLATLFGFAAALVSFLAGLGYLVYKLLFWDSFETGMAPIVIGLFFFTAIQLIFIGIIGEYIGAIYTQVKNWPLVIEKERINFDVGFLPERGDRDVARQT